MIVTAEDTRRCEKNPVLVPFYPAEMPRGPNWNGKRALGDRMPLTRMVLSTKFEILHQDRNEISKSLFRLKMNFFQIFMLLTCYGSNTVR